MGRAACCWWRRPPHPLFLTACHPQPRRGHVGIDVAFGASALLAEIKPLHIYSRAAEHRVLRQKAWRSIEQRRHAEVVLQCARAAPHILPRAQVEWRLHTVRSRVVRLALLQLPNRLAHRGDPLLHAIAVTLVDRHLKLKIDARVRQEVGQVGPRGCGRPVCTDALDDERLSGQRKLAQEGLVREVCQSAPWKLEQRHSGSRRKLRI